VADLQRTLTAMRREQESGIGSTREYSAHLTQELREKEMEIQQLSQEVACYREEATCMQRAHVSACQQIQHLTGELDHIAAVRCFLCSGCVCGCSVIIHA
jgi:chromosome segregation ATPase